MNSLFDVAAEQNLQSPLAARLRPTRLEHVVGQDHLLGEGKPLRRLIETDSLSSVILWGPAGTGKTSLAMVIASRSKKHFEKLSAVNATVKDLRAVIEQARSRLGQYNQGTILFLDEIHRFNKAQQDALLPVVEDGTLVLVGATTENPFFEVNGPLLSRATLFRLNPLSDEALKQLLDRALEVELVQASPEALAHIVNQAAGDARSALTTLEVAIALAKPTTKAAPGEDQTNNDIDLRKSGLDKIYIELEHAEAAADLKSLRYGNDGHYDTVSAFIKSMRGSDPDAALYWLARMLAAGEDARFIARRLVIFASEDVGMADSTALLVANAAAHAVEYVGLPEAQINLAHAVVYLAKAPKSNASYKGLLAAQADIAARPAGEIPKHLRDAHYKGAASLGHGKGYKYPHDYPNAKVDQQYLPDELLGSKYYKE